MRAKTKNNWHGYLLVDHAGQRPTQLLHHHGVLTPPRITNTTQQTWQCKDGQRPCDPHHHSKTPTTCQLAKDGLLWCPSRETTFAFRLGWVWVVNTGGSINSWSLYMSVLLAGGLSGWLLIRWLVCSSVRLCLSFAPLTMDISNTWRWRGAHRDVFPSRHLSSSWWLRLCQKGCGKSWRRPLLDRCVSRCVSWWRRSPLGCRWQKLQLTENHGIRWNPESSRANMKGWKDLQRL